MLENYSKWTWLSTFSKFLGLRYLNKLTDFSDCDLWVEITTSDGENKYAEYKWVY